MQGLWVFTHSPFFVTVNISTIMKTLREQVLSLNQEEIYSAYLFIPVEDILWSTTYSSNKIKNVHRGETNASMSFKWYGDKLIARDFGDSRYSGDVFKIVGFIIGKNAMDNHDFVDICSDILETYYNKHVKRKNVELDVIKEEKEIKVITTNNRLLQKRDYNYYNQYGIINRTVDRFVKAVIRYSVNGRLTGYKNSYKDPCYEYVVNRDFTKLYFPNRHKNSPYPRFITNNILALDDIDTIFHCTDIIIVKSIKDKMLLIQMLEKMKICDICILTAASETTCFPDNIMKILRSRCKNNIYAMFDIDTAGINAMNELERTSNIIPLIFSTEAKDPTDYAKANGYLKAFDVFTGIIKFIISNRTTTISI